MRQVEMCCSSAILRLQRPVLQYPQPLHVVGTVRTTTLLNTATVSEMKKTGHVATVATVYTCSTQPPPVS